MSKSIHLKGADCYLSPRNFERYSPFYFSTNCKVLWFIFFILICPLFPNSPKLDGKVFPTMLWFVPSLLWNVKVFPWPQTLLIILIIIFWLLITAVLISLYRFRLTGLLTQTGCTCCIQSNHWEKIWILLEIQKSCPYRLHFRSSHLWTHNDCKYFWFFCCLGYSCWYPFPFIHKWMYLSCRQRIRR